jgi:SAM-dependent methyltransferase
VHQSSGRQTMNRRGMVEEYNNYFLRNPHKWEREESNQLAWLNLKEYLGRDPATVVDIGCGNGHTIAYLSKKWNKTMFMGMDLSDVAIRIATERRLARAIFEVGFADLYFPSVKFQVCLLLGVAEHFENPENTLRAIRESILRPGGVLYIEVPNCIAYPESEPVEGFRKLACGSRQTEWHLRRETWEGILVAAGYSIERYYVGPRMQNEFIWVLKGR